MRTANSLTNAISRKRGKHMHNTTVPLPVTSDPGWSKTQRRLLTVLEQEGHRTKTIKEICQLAGYASESAWHRALRDERFAAIVHTFDIKRNRKRSASRLSDVQQHLLEVLRQEQHQQKSIAEVCQLAGCTPSAWRWALKDEQFLKIVKALDVTFRRNIRIPHLEVTLVLTTVYNCAQIKLTDPRDGCKLWEMLLSIPTGDGHDQEQDSEYDTRIISTREVHSRHCDQPGHRQK